MLGKQLRFLSVFSLLIVVFSLATHGAEQWSEPVKTKPWSETVTTTPWGENGILEAPAQSLTIMDYRELLGFWDIWSPGGVVVKIGPQDSYAGYQPLDGSSLGRLVIVDDGTYIMRHDAWEAGNVVAGVWRLSYPREINGEIIQAIILQEGITGVDWAVAPAPSGKIRLLWAMYWNDGSATWVYDSDLYHVDVE